MQLVKKVALVFLASGVFVGTLAGCGEKKEEPKKVEVTPPKVEVK